jgi:hypothetical protein
MEAVNGCPLSTAKAGACNLKTSPKFNNNPIQTKSLGLRLS